MAPEYILDNVRYREIKDYLDERSEEGELLVRISDNNPGSREDHFDVVSTFEGGGEIGALMDFNRRYTLVCSANFAAKLNEAGVSLKEAEK